MIYEEIIEFISNAGIWVKPQFIIILEDKDGSIYRTYHILCGNNMDFILMFLKKNADVIEAEDIVPKFKLLFSESNSYYIKSRMKGSIVSEIGDSYYVIDFESLTDLEDQHYDYLKEENFDVLNEHYYENIFKPQDVSKLNKYPKVSSKMTIHSSENKDGVNLEELSMIEIALLDDIDQLRPKSKHRLFIF
jgi:hypothetical protein